MTSEYLRHTWAITITQSNAYDVQRKGQGGLDPDLNVLFQTSKGAAAATQWPQVTKAAALFKKVPF